MQCCGEYFGLLRLRVLKSRSQIRILHLASAKKNVQISQVNKRPTFLHKIVKQSSCKIFVSRSCMTRTDCINDFGFAIQEQFGWRFVVKILTMKFSLWPGFLHYLYQYAQKSNTVPVGINLEWCISSSKSHTSVHLCEISKTNKKS